MTGDISHLLPNFKAEYEFSYETSQMFPIIKEFPEQNTKLTIKSGDSQSLERSNRRSIANIESLAFNFTELN